MIGGHMKEMNSTPILNSKECNPQFLNVSAEGNPFGSVPSPHGPYLGSGLEASNYEERDPVHGTLPCVCVCACAVLRYR